MNDLLKAKVLTLKEDAESQLSILNFKKESVADLLEATKSFTDDLAYVSLGGSCSYGGGLVGSSDIDIGVVFKDSVLQCKSRVSVLISEFIPNYTQFNLTNGFVPDHRDHD